MRWITLRHVAIWLLIFATAVGSTRFCAQCRGQSYKQIVTTGHVTDGVQINIRTKDAILAHGQPLQCFILLKNLRKIALPLRECEADSDFEIDVKDARKNEVPFTSHWTKINDFVGTGPAFRVQLAEGRQRSYSLRVDEIYDMSRPGVYFITVSRWVPSSKGDLDVKVSSNTLKVMVK